jgi:protein-disulfide isomerase
MTTSSKRMPAAAAPQQRQLLIIIAIVAVVAIIAIAAIALSGQVASSSVNFGELPQSRTSDGAFVLGDPNAPITIVEFADFGCPHCQEYHGTMTSFIEQFVVTGKAKFEYRSFPTAGGPITEFASKVQECAEQQRPGAYWEAYKLYYDLAMTARFNEDAHRIVARELGLNYSDILQCTESATQVRTDVAFGANNGVSGTPAVMMRLGDGAAQWINYNGVTYNRGSVPLDVLAAVVNSYQ